MRIILGVVINRHSTGIVGIVQAYVVGIVDILYRYKHSREGVRPKPSHTNIKEALSLSFQNKINFMSLDLSIEGV